MPIIYACIARAKDATILVESTAPELGGNAPQISLALMEYIRDHPKSLEEGARKTWLQKNEGTKDFFSGMIEACAGGYDTLDGTEHYFHTFKKNGVIYSCLSDDDDQRQQSVNFDFLTSLHSDFTNSFRAGRIARANAYGMDKQFAPNIRTSMHYYNTNHQKLTREQKVQKTLTEIENLKESLGQNIQLVLRQTENLEKMAQKSEVAKKNSMVFKKKANQLHRKLWWMNTSSCLILSIVVVCLIYVMFAMSCGWRLTGCRVSQGNGASQAAGDDQAAGAN